MIHLFIFAGPKPGLSGPAFTSYWINFHSVDYAAKIPQIRQYLVSERVHLRGARDLPFFEGVAEIWLENETEQIASLQSPEFLDGARRDEPRWAAFWNTLVLDTEAQVLREFAGPQPWPAFVKLYTLIKRRPDLPLERFRRTLLGERLAWPAPDGLERHLVALARTSLYGLGEPRFDAIEALSFRGKEPIAALLGSNGFLDALSGPAGADPRYLFTFVGQEHWIIRPGER
jgi:EthD domain